MRSALLRREPQSQQKVQLGLFRDLLAQRPLPSAPLAPNTSSQTPLHPSCFRRLSLPQIWATPRSCPFLGPNLCPLLLTLPVLAGEGRALIAHSDYCPGPFTQEHRIHLPYSLCPHRRTEAQTSTAKTFDQQRSIQWNQFQVSGTYEGLGI